ncbi:antiviral reverse transcriptase Drt3a [Planctomycetota bacterium]
MTLDQSYYYSSLRRLFRKRDVYRHNLWSTKKDAKTMIEQIAYNVDNLNDDFISLHIRNSGSINIVSAANIETDIVLRNINRFLQKFYKVCQADRNMIIRQVNALLQESCEYWILRLDIEDFYGSITRESLINKIFDDGTMSLRSRRLLKKTFDMLSSARLYGLPRGLSISARLSEIYMRDFDNFVIRAKEVYFYRRYVDDIIIFLHKEPSSFITKIETKLKGLGLKLNPDKIYNEFIPGKKGAHLTPSPFDYLGYKFTFSNYGNSREWRKISLAISQSKIKRIKSRVAKSFLEFSRNYDISLLRDRIKFLTGNYRLNRNKNGVLKAGIYFNYPYLSSDKDLQDLDLFLRKRLFSNRGTIGTALRNHLSMITRRQLAKYSFKEGYSQKLVYSFGYSRMREITKCWKYDKT